MLAAAAGLLDSVEAAAAVVAVALPEAAVRAPRLLLPLLVVADLPVGPEVLRVAQVPPLPLPLRLLPLRLPQVVVESEVTLHLKGRRSFSAAMARSSPPTVQPTYARAPNTR
jgi:hypothetical protein